MADALKVIKVYHNNSKTKLKEIYTVDSDNHKHGLYCSFFEDGEPETEITYDKDEPIILKKYKQSRIQEIIHLKNGKKNGPYKEYYSNAQLKTDAYYIDNKLNGPFVSYHGNGEYEKKATYENNRLVGIFESFHEDGSLKERIEYKNNKPEEVSQPKLKPKNINELFPYEERYIGGEIKIKAFRNITGAFIGVYKEFYENGQPKVSANYNDRGRLEGVYEEFYENGKPKREMNYINDCLTGSFNAYYKSGKPQVKDNYLNNKLHGLCYGYYESGEIQYESNYMDDKSIATEYYESGIISAITLKDKNGQPIRKVIYYENGQPEAVIRDIYAKTETRIYIKYYEDGTLKEKGIFTKYHENGFYEKYDEKGKFIKKMYHVDAHEISVAEMAKIKNALNRKKQFFAKQIDPERREKVQMILDLRKDEKFNALKEGKKFKEAYARFEALKSQKQQKSKVR